MNLMFREQQKAPTSGAFSVQFSDATSSNPRPSRAPSTTPIYCSDTGVVAGGVGGGVSSAYPYRLLQRVMSQRRQRLQG
jgi:hypothetical protein